ncbi:hypothetical protein J2X42_002626 [Arthrobacter sp. BE255]|nr:hypothetical protein [Arthrobacter sp. BE255]
MGLHFQHDWWPAVGHDVEIRHNGRVVRTGHVDAVTADDEILWVQHDGARHRELFEKSEGFEVWMECTGATQHTPIFL